MALTPEEIAQAEALEASATPEPLNPLRDLSADDLAALAVADKSFVIADEFQRQPELHADPVAVQKVADAFNKVKQRGFKVEDLPTVGEATKAVTTAGKGLVGQLWNYANVVPNLVGGAVSELVGAEGLAGGFAENINQRLAENIAGTEEAMTGIGQLVEKGVAKAGRATGVTKALEDYTPQERVTDLFNEAGRSEVRSERLTGKGEFTKAVTGEEQDLDPERVGELAAGDPFSFYLFGKASALGGQAVRAATPEAVRTAISAGTRAVERAAETAVPKVVGGAVTAAGRTAEAGAATAEFAGKVASVAGPIAGGLAAVTGADVSGSALSGLVAGTGGVALRKVGQRARPIAQKISDIGRQISGSRAVTSAYAQGARDALQALPGAAGEIAKGTALDVGLAAATSELPQDTQGAIGFGTAIGALAGARQVGGRVLSGQLIAPREYGVNRVLPSSGQFPTFDTMHRDAMQATTPGVRARLNAVRDFMRGSAPNADVFLARDAASAERALIEAGVSPLTARQWAAQEGVFTTSLPGRDGSRRTVAIVRNVEAAPHEAFHAVQDVLGESANRQIDSLIRETYAAEWQNEGRKYAQRLGIDPSVPWQEGLLDASGWGTLEAKEKIYRDIANQLEGETGAVPAPQLVEQMARAEFGRVMDAALERGQQLEPNQIQERVWRDILTPEEAAAVADRYIAREIAAEHFDALLKNRGPRLEEGNQVPQRLAQIVGKFISALGVDPVAGRTSEFGQVPLRTPVLEAVETAARPPEVAPRSTPAPSVRTTPTAPVGTPERAQQAADEARVLAEDAPTTPPVGGTRSQRELLGEIAEAIAVQGGVKLNYLSAPGEPAAALTSNRTARRAVIEAFRTMPAAARALWEKTFFPDRVIRTRGGKYQVQGWAPEVFAANAHKVANFLAETPGAERLSPYPIDPTSKTFTDAGWQELYSDAQTFVQNQMRGATGSGEPLVVPRSVTEAGGFAPPTRPGAVPLDQTRADFINLLFNFKLPETPRIQAGRRPLNVQGQDVSVATLPGRVEVPVRPRGEFTGEEAARQGIEGRQILEVNPLRNQLEVVAQASGKPVPSLIEAIQKLNLENIVEVQNAPEVPQFRGNTLTLTAGFQPRAGEQTWRVRGQLRGQAHEITVNAADMADARRQGEAQGMRVAAVENADKFENAMFQPATARGRQLEEQGFEIRHTGGPSNPSVVLLRDGVPAGDIQAVRKSPTEADIAFINVNPNFRGQGLSEILYREMGRRLQEEGVDNVTGMIVNPRALSVRSRVFPDTQIENVISTRDDAAFEVRSRIPADAQFSPVELADRVEKFTPTEFREWARTVNNNFTGEAHRIGMEAPTQEFVNSLKSRYEALSPKAMEAIRAGNFDDASAIASQAQFFREAYEAATGTASAGAALRRANPDFKAPFPIEATAQAQPAPFDPRTGRTPNVTDEFVRRRPIDLARTSTEALQNLAAGSRLTNPRPWAGTYKDLVAQMPLDRSVRKSGDFERAADRLDQGITSEEWAKIPYKEQKIINDILLHEAEVTGLPVKRANRGEITSQAQPAAADDIRALADDYAKRAGITYNPKLKTATPNTDLLKRVSDFYEQAETAPNDPAVRASYEALANETIDQYQAIVDAGYVLEPWDGQGEPYANSAAMVKDVRDNKHLYYFRTQEGFGREGDAPSQNAMLEDSGVVINGEPVPVNDLFRAVHDFFGHAKEGHQFGPKGEFNAWGTHAEMYSDAAQGALAAETLAQNAFVNFGPHMRTDTGAIRQQGDAGFIPLRDRPFAEQKNIIIPQDIIEEARAQFAPRKKKQVIEGDGWIDPTGKFHHTTEHHDFAESQLSEQEKTGVSGNFTGALIKKGWVRVAHGVDATYANAKELNRAQRDLLEDYAVEKNSKIILDATPDAVKVLFDYSTDAAQFAPRKKAATDKYKLKTGAGGFSKAWILPSGEPVQLGGTWHHQWLADNPEIAARYNLDVPAFEGTDTEGVRENALKAGFARINYDNRNGTLIVEARARDWRKVKGAVEQIAEANLDNIDNMRVSLLDEAATRVVDSQSARLFNYDDAEKMQHLPFITEGEIRGQFQPAGELGLDVTPDNRRAQRAIRAQVKEAQARYPEALPLQLRREEDGSFSVDPKGKAKPVGIPYGLDATPLAKQAVRGVRGEEAREQAIVDAFAERLKADYERAAQNPAIAAGADWYSLAREKLANLFGDDTKFFTELLGATSAQTDVPTNFEYAVDAYNNFKQGKYDAQIAKYREGKELWEDIALGPQGRSQAAVRALKAAKLGDEPTRAAFMKYWIDKHDLKPRKTNGKLFGANSDAVLKVLDGSWREEVQGPKTPNFAGNLSGDSFEATIDVWAARMLHRLGNQGNEGRWRILPKNEIGVTDSDFFLGQRIFRKAGDDLGVSPDSLQAIMWFAEKDIWEKNGWTKTAGATKSDFNTFLDVTRRGEESGLVEIGELERPTAPREATPQLDLGIDPGY